MANAFFNVPKAINEPVKSYAPGSAERKELQETIATLKNSTVDLPMIIGGKEIRTGKKISMHPPHEIAHVLGSYHQGDANHVSEAIDAAMAARKTWAITPWQDRAAIFLKAAELLAGPYRVKMNAATMLCQSKNAFQAEIDSACEMIDFFRFNVQFMTEIYQEQPISAPGIWNRLEYRPLEGFVFALTPFNFTSIAANLCAAPALMGNVVVWKPSNTQIYSAHVIMELFKEAGLPDGVINIIHVNSSVIADTIFKSPYFSGVHFTGSTSVFNQLWKTIGSNLEIYKGYPRIVGETGGKDFIIAHKSSNPAEVATAIVRGAFEFQGQKCSAASRVYLPSNLADEILDLVKKDVESFKIGSPEDFGNFINAVIDEKSFDKIANYIEYTKSQNDAEFVCGGTYDKSKGYFISPTVVKTTNPLFKTMCEEIFGPFLTVFVYEADKYVETLELLDKSSEYALTGAIFSKDRASINIATQVLENAAGNFYINDKPTGAVVGQQPFGGARASGTNDKAGAAQNLMRWVNSRTIKETFVPPTDYRYPFLG
ncbi:MAG: L-glutamate gamma-semialdehyde dehydrogenase [Flavobacteriales bacterium]|nr:L-glutamate gamma-semialdehyde dehydrogenase [Flavobacteriales bacterium]